MIKVNGISDTSRTPQMHGCIMFSFWEQIIKQLVDSKMICIREDEHVSEIYLDPDGIYFKIEK